MITLIPLSDTRITETIEFIRRYLTVVPFENEQLENRLLYELILSSQRAGGVCTLAVDGDEEIVGVTINRIRRGSQTSSTTPTPPATWSELVGDPWRVKETIQARSNELLQMLSETDWRAASASSLVGAADMIYDNPLLRVYKQFETFVHGSLQNCVNDALVVELVLIATNYHKQGLGTMMINDLIEFGALNSIYSIHIFSTQPCFTKLLFQKAQTNDQFCHLMRTIKLSSAQQIL